MSVRVRFAPSPTGLLHVGALRTALYDHLLAKHFGGQNILRIEDTDRERYNADSEREFVETLHWVGIDFDEGPHVGGPFGPYRQSERKEGGIYAPLIAQVLEAGYAYKAFDTPQEIEEMREIQKANKLSVGYFGGEWRDADPAKTASAEDAGRTFVVRQRIPRDRRIVVEDAVRGKIEFDSDILPDPVLIKTDGMPTYHFAAVVDDHLMEITHVLRGEEWLSSSPYHWLLYEQFGWERPAFVHCPTINGNDGKKLSKRHGATRVLDYAAQGYTKDALKNFIALIGWSPGDEREVMSSDELVAAFSLDGLQPSPGKFDIEKLRWLNSHQIRLMTPDDLLDAVLALAQDSFTREYWTSFVDTPEPNKAPLEGNEVLRKLDLIVETEARDHGYALRALKEVQQRVITLTDFGDAMEFFLVEEPPMDAKAVDKWLRQPDVPELMSWLDEKLVSSGIETIEGFESLVRGYAEQKGMEKLGPVVHPLRVALTGKTSGPGLFELMAVLGPSRIRRRLARVASL